MASAIRREQMGYGDFLGWVPVISRTLSCGTPLAIRDAEGFSVRYPSFLLALAGAMYLTGCTDWAKPQTLVEAPPFSAPFNAVAQDQTDLSHILLQSDGDLYIPRNEKVAYGGLSLGTTAAYSVYTYDSQKISIRHSGGTGYRHSTLMEGGVILLPAP
jgi:hypothetical protein